VRGLTADGIAVLDVESIAADERVRVEEQAG
jgi:hypothetical protein